jgi:circadian clock protein KaiB
MTKRVSAGRPSDSVRAYEAAAKKAARRRYELRLYIAGTTPLSAAALSNVLSVCEEHLPGRYDLVVIDVYQQPANAKSDQIIAVPALLKTHPPPTRRLIGDLSNRSAVLLGLDLPPDTPRAAHEEDP